MQDQKTHAWLWSRQQQLVSPDVSHPGREIPAESLKGHKLTDYACQCVGKYHNLWSHPNQGHPALCNQCWPGCMFQAQRIVDGKCRPVILHGYGGAKYPCSTSGFASHVMTSTSGTPLTAGCLLTKSKLLLVLIVISHRIQFERYLWISAYPTLICSLWVKNVWESTQPRFPKSQRKNSSAESTRPRRLGRIGRTKEQEESTVPGH